MVDELRTTNVNLNGLLSVLGQHLYSTPTVAVRELIQNAHDAITRRRLETGWQDDGRIEVSGDRASAVLRICDNGSGLTEGEIHAFLATVGIGYTRALREQNASDELIGLFGLGFLSAFVIASKVTVLTCSYQTPDISWRYQSLDGEHYWVSQVPARGAIGTTIELELRDDFAFLADISALSRVLQRYCLLLREPIYLGADRINALIPPWRLPDLPVAVHPVQARKRDLAFASQFEQQFEPICTIPVRAQAPSDLRGLLWVQDGSTYGGSDNRNLSVYLRGMLLDDDARDLLPRWAGFIGGVIETAQLTPTASREDLQRDQAYAQTQKLLQETLITGLAQLASEQPEAWKRVLARHDQELLGVALCNDRLFDLLADVVPLPTSQGDMPVRGLIHDGAIHVSMGGASGFEDMLFRTLSIPVARGDRYAVLSFLRRWVERRGGRLVELGTEHGDGQMFQREDPGAAAAKWLQQHLAGPGEAVICARFLPVEMPLVLVPDRDAELKRRLAEDRDNKRISMSALRLARDFAASLDVAAASRLYINLDNPAISTLLLQQQRNGESLPSGVATALALLRGLKTVLMSAGAGGNADYNRAFRDIAEAIIHLSSNTDLPEETIA